MPTPRHPQTVLVRAGAALVLLTFASFGCSTRIEPTGPAAAVPTHDTGSLAGAGNSARGFYPLATGNHWTYARTFVNELRPDTGPPVTTTISSTAENEQVCTEWINGRAYQVERVTTHEGQNTYRSWIRYRQDREGLYEYDTTDTPACDPLPAPARAGIATVRDDAESRLRELCSAMPPAQQAAWLAAAERVDARARTVMAALHPGTLPGAYGKAPGELQRLAYPLHTGASWILRSDPDIVFRETVEGSDALHTPAGTFVGSRIAIEFGLLGPNDRIRVWYGRNGYLGLHYHFEGFGTDENGNPIGNVVVEFTETLTSLSLVAPTTEAIQP